MHELAHKICPQCEARVLDEHRFCPACGLDISAVTALDGDPYLGLVIEDRYRIDELLGAPVVTGDVELELKVLTYEYLDPELEDLSGAQKQLLRAGPINVARIQGKLRKLAFALGIPEHDLPRPSFHEARTPDTEEGP